MPRKSLASFIAFAAGAVLAFQPAHAQWSVVSLHPLRSEASNIRAGVGGRQFGTSKPEGGNIHAALWDSTAASQVDLNPLNSSTSFVFDAHGAFQVGLASFGAGQAGFWMGTAESWTSLAPDGSTSSAAYAVEGGVIGGNVDFGAGNRATVWSGPGFSTRADLHPVGVDESIVYAIDGANQYGIAATNSTVYAAAWSGSAASFVNLNPAVASASRIDRADGGRQVGWAEVNGERRASLWSGSVASWVDLTPAGLGFCQALAIDGDLQAGFVGSDQFVDSDRVASVWRGSAASWEDLSVYLVGNWGETRAFAAWNDGVTQFVGGFGRNLDTDEIEALLWSQPIPAPGAATLIGVGGSFAAMRRRRR